MQQPQTELADVQALGEADVRALRESYLADSEAVGRVLVVRRTNKNDPWPSEWSASHHVLPLPLPPCPCSMAHMAATRPSR
jgi:isopentenyldiphosphate isomerase